MDKGYCGTPGLPTIPWHLKRFGVVLPGLALETSKVYIEKAKRGFGSGGNCARVCW